MKPSHRVSVTVRTLLLALLPIAFEWGDGHLVSHTSWEQHLQPGSLGIITWAIGDRAAGVLLVLLVVALSPGGWRGLPRPEVKAAPRQLWLIIAAGLAGSLALGHIAGLLTLPIIPLERMYPWLGRTAPLHPIIWSGPDMLRGAVPLLLAPIQEELLFRAYLFGTLRVALGRNWGLLLSTAAFMLVHTGVQVDALPGIFAAGLVYALVYEAAGSIWPAIVVHMAYNFVVTFSPVTLLWRLLLGLTGGVALVGWLDRWGPLRPRPWNAGHLAPLVDPDLEHNGAA